MIQFLAALAILNPDELKKRMNSSFSSIRPGAIHPILQVKSFGYNSSYSYNRPGADSGSVYDGSTAKPKLRRLNYWTYVNAARPDSEIPDVVDSGAEVAGELAPQAVLEVCHLRAHQAVEVLLDPKQ